MIIIKNLIVYFVKASIVIPTMLSVYRYRGTWSEILWYLILLPSLNSISSPYVCNTTNKPLAFCPGVCLDVCHGIAWNKNSNICCIGHIAHLRVRTCCWLILTHSSQSFAISLLRHFSVHRFFLLTSCGNQWHEQEQNTKPRFCCCEDLFDLCTYQ